MGQGISEVTDTIIESAKVELQFYEPVRQVNRRSSLTGSSEGFHLHGLKECDRLIEAFPIRPERQAHI